MDYKELIKKLDNFTASDHFLEDFERIYSTLHPPFFEGTFTQAITVAKQLYKIVIVYLHHELHEHTLPFCLQTLCSQAVSEIIQQHFVFWVGEIDSSKESNLGNQFPFLALIADVGNGVNLLEIIKGEIFVDELITRLINVQDSYGKVLQKFQDEQLAKEEQLHEERHMKLVQEIEYEDALAEDRKKEKEKEQQIEEERRQTLKEQLALEEKRKQIEFKKK